MVDEAACDNGPADAQEAVVTADANTGDSGPARRKSRKRRWLKRLLIIAVIHVVVFSIYRFALAPFHFVRHPDGLAVFGKQDPMWRDTFVSLDEINRRIARTTPEDLSQIYASYFLDELRSRGVALAEPGSAPNEDRALGLLETIWKNEHLFKDDSDDESYGTLEALATAQPPYVDARLAEGRLSGYVFRVEVDKPADGGEGGFRVYADPEDVSFGSPHFFVDQSGAVHSTLEHPAGPDDPRHEETFQVPDEEAF